MKNIEQLKLDSNFAIIEKDEQVIISTWKIIELNSLWELEKLQIETRKKIIFITPFCLARDEKWYDVIWDEKIIAMEVEKEICMYREDLLSILPNEEVKFWKIETNISDLEFSKMVENAKLDISNWEFNQIILSRDFSTKLDVDVSTILSIYSKLLKNRWQYMTYLFNTDNDIFIWASPEKHLLIDDSDIYMNPIAWTIWKLSFDSFIERLLKFLKDDKEIGELSMVIDEELKMLSKITKSGNIEVPLLKEVWAVIHTEANLNWTIKDGISLLGAFRETLYAPTLVWGPLESAFSNISKYEKDSRWYYWWSFWVLWDDFLDTCIVIRTAFIDKLNSILSVRAWAGIVKDSDPKSEAQETILKSNWFFWSIQWKNSVNSQLYLSNLTLDENISITRLLENRKTKLSNFYLNSHLNENLEVEEIKGKKFVLINNWDDFVYLSWFMIKRMWWVVEIIDNKDFYISLVNASDIILLWPGYWDINNKEDEKMLKLLEITKTLISKDIKLLWICLWHQAICKTMWYEIAKQEKITQWEQKDVIINWKTEKLWFYNSFSPVDNWLLENIEIFNWDRILTYKSENISSTQAHPESIMSINWFDILKNMIMEII